MTQVDFLLIIVRQGEEYFFFFFYVLYSTLLHLLPLEFHCVEGCWDRTHNFGIGIQTLKTLR
jgi:hypothetical protein